MLLLLLDVELVVIHRFEHFRWFKPEKVFCSVLTARIWWLIKEVTQTIFPLQQFYAHSISLRTQTHTHAHKYKYVYNSLSFAFSSFKFAMTMKNILFSLTFDYAVAAVVAHSLFCSVCVPHFFLSIGSTSLLFRQRQHQIFALSLHIQQSASIFHSLLTCSSARLVCWSLARSIHRYNHATNM